MELLLDTHTFLWWLDGDPRLLWWLDGDPKLSARARTAISADPTKVQVSAATAWEIATKARIGKLPQALDVAADVTGCVTREGFRPLAVTTEHGQRRAPCPGRCAIRSTAC